MIDPTLMAIVDPSCLSLNELSRAIEAVVRGGATCVQVRAKRVAVSFWIRYVREAAHACRRSNTAFLVNDRVDLALLSGANGVHVGDDDLPVAEARRLLGDGAVIGATARSAEAVEAAADRGADYAGVGPLFRSSTKGDLVPLERNVIRRIRERSPIPVVGIGGIGAATAHEAGRLGLDGIAVISALWRTGDWEENARELKGRFLEGRR